MRMTFVLALKWTFIQCYQFRNNLFIHQWWQTSLNSQTFNPLDKDKIDKLSRAFLLRVLQIASSHKVYRNISMTGYKKEYFQRTHYWKLLKFGMCKPHIMLFPSKPLWCAESRNALMFGLAPIRPLNARRRGYVFFSLISDQASGNCDSVARRTWNSPRST